MERPASVGGGGPASLSAPPVPPAPPDAPEPPLAPEPLDPPDPAEPPDVGFPPEPLEPPEPPFALPPLATLPPVVPDEPPPLPPLSLVPFVSSSLHVTRAGKHASAATNNTDHEAFGSNHPPYDHCGQGSRHTDWSTLPSFLQQLFGQSASTVHCCRHVVVPNDTQIELQQGLCEPQGCPTATQLAHSAAVPQTFRVTLPNFRQQPDVQSPSISHGMRQIGFGVASTHSLPGQHVAPLAPQLTSMGTQPPAPVPAPPPVPETPPVPEPPVPNPPEPEAPLPDPLVPPFAPNPPLPLTPPLPAPPLEEDAADPPAPPVIAPPADDALEPPLLLAEDPPELVPPSESESLLQPLERATATRTPPIAKVSERTKPILHHHTRQENRHARSGGFARHCFPVKHDCALIV